MTLSIFGISISIKITILMIIWMVVLITIMHTATMRDHINPIVFVNRFKQYTRVVMKLSGYFFTLRDVLHSRLQILQIT